MSAEPLSTQIEDLDSKTVNLADAPLERGGMPGSLVAVEERLAGILGAELSSLLRVRVQVELKQTTAVRFRELTEEQEPGVVNVLEFEQLGGLGVLDLSWPTFFAILDRLFGGTSTVKPPQRNRLSKVEERVARRITHVFARSMETAWRGVVPFTVKHLRIETRIASSNLTTKDEWVLQTSYEIRAEGESLGQLRLLMPSALLDPFRNRLSGPSEPRKKRDYPWEDDFRKLLPDVPVELVAELGRAQMTLDQILSLQVGEVIRLNQPAERPVMVSIAGVPKYRGDISVHFGNIAIQLRSADGRTLQAQDQNDE